ncbi:MAG TPA: peroxidase family protein, partial [Phycicoccus sp.]
HTFGKTHGAGDADLVGPEPEGCPVHAMGLGWKSEHGTGKGADAITSGLEVTWTYHPTRWDNEFFHILFAYEWELMKSPAGAWQWRPKNGAGSDMVPGAADGAPRREPRMLTSDLALRFDPEYEEISRRFHDNPEEFQQAFAKAWYKLLHRDMGPVSRFLGPWVPEAQLWQDPVPAVEGELVTDDDVARLKEALLGSGLSVQQLVRTAWASASTFRGTDYRGGANGARIRLEPQRGWAANDPDELGSVLEVLERIKADFDGSGDRTVSLADLIVLGGCTGVEKAARDAGFEVTVPFTPGRTDATAEMTDVESFSVLEPRADGFRNYLRPGEKAPAEMLLLDKAYLLTLTAPEMTVLLGGLRAIGATSGGSSLGVLTERPGQLTNDFFVNVLDMGTEWTTSRDSENVFDGRDRASGDVRWSATAADLVFGSHSQLRAIGEVYASADAGRKMVDDFVAAWDKVMMLDRFDVR